jgi:hypothetical protein
MQARQSLLTKYSGENHHAALSKYFPEKKEVKHRVLRDPIAIKMTHLHPNTTIFYFAAQAAPESSSIVSRDVAYGTLQNSFVARVSPRGESIIIIEKPQIYVDVDGNINKRHFHFVYWKDGAWSSHIYTHGI